MTRPIPDHYFHLLEDYRLLYIIKDASEAAQAMRGMDYRAECKYLDQVNDACTVLRYRRLTSSNPMGNNL
jgi:hypothetical protein